MSLAKRLLAAAAALREAAPSKDDAERPDQDDNGDEGPKPLTSSTQATAQAGRRFIEFAKSNCSAAIVSSRLNVTFEDVVVHVRSDGLFIADRTKLLLRHIALPMIAEAVWLPPVEDPQGRPGGARLRLVIRGEHDVLLARSEKVDTTAKKRESAVKALKALARSPSPPKPALDDTADKAGLWRESEESLFTVANNLKIATQTNGDFCPFLEREAVPDSSDDPEASPVGLVALRPAADYQSVFARAQLRRRGSDKYVPPEDQLTLAAWDSIEAPLPPSLRVDELPPWARWAVPHGAHVVMFGNVLLLHPVAYFDEENRPVIVERAARLRGAALAAAFEADGGTRNAISKKAKKRLEGAAGTRGDAADDDEVVPAVVIFTATHLLIVYDPLRTVRLHLATLQTAIVHRTTTKRPPRRVEFMFATAEASCTVDIALGTHPYRSGNAAGAVSDDGDEQQTYNAAIVADVVVSLSNRLGLDAKVSQRNEVASVPTTAAVPNGAVKDNRSSQQGGQPSTSASETRLVANTTDTTPVARKATADGDAVTSSDDDDGVASPPVNDPTLAPLFRDVASPHHVVDEDEVGEGTVRNDSRLGGWDTLAATATTTHFGGVWDAAQRQRRSASRARAAARPFRALRLVPDRHKLPLAYVSRFGSGAFNTIIVRRVLRETSKQALVKRYAVLVAAPADDGEVAAATELFNDTDESQDTDNDVSIANAVHTRARRRRVERLVLCDDKGVVHRDIPVASILRINCISSEDVVAIFVMNERPILIRPDGDKTRNPVAPDGTVENLGLRVTDLVTVMARSTGRKPYVVSNPREVLDAAAVTTEAQAAAWRREHALDRARQEEESRRGRELPIKVAARAAATAAFRKDLVVKAARQLAHEQRQHDAFAAAESASRARHASQHHSPPSPDPRVSPIGKLPNDSSVLTSVPSPPGSPTLPPSSPSPGGAAAARLKKRPLMATLGGASSLHTAVLNEERVHRNVIEDSELGVLRVLWMRETTDKRKALEAVAKRLIRTLWALERLERGCLSVERAEGVARLTTQAKGMRSLIVLIRAGEVLNLHAREDIERRRFAIDFEVSAFRLLRDARGALATCHLAEDTVGCEARETVGRRGTTFNEERARLELVAQCAHGAASHDLLRQRALLSSQIRERFVLGAHALEEHLRSCRFAIAVASLFAEAIDERCAWAAEWRRCVTLEYQALQRAATSELEWRWRSACCAVEVRLRERMAILASASAAMCRTFNEATRAARRVAATMSVYEREMRSRANIVAAQARDRDESQRSFGCQAIILEESVARRSMCLTIAAVLQVHRRELQSRLAVYHLEGGEFRHLKSDFVALLPRPDPSHLRAAGTLVAMEVHLSNLRHYRRLAGGNENGRNEAVEPTPDDIGRVGSELADRATFSGRDGEDPPAVRSLIAQESSRRSDIAADELHSRPAFNFHLFARRATVGPNQRPRSMTTAASPPPSVQFVGAPWDDPPLQREESSGAAPYNASFARGATPPSIAAAGVFNTAESLASDKAKSSDFLSGRPTPLATPERGAYEAIGLLRVRVKAPLSTFLFYCNKGFSRRLEAAGGAGSAWSNIPPECKCVCVGEALHGAAVVSSQTLQRLMLNSSVVSCGNGGSGGGSSAGMPPCPETSSVALAGFDPVISRHVSVRLASLLFVAVDVREFLPRWSAGQEPCDMVVPD